MKKIIFILAIGTYLLTYGFILNIRIKEGLQPLIAHSQKATKQNETVDIGINNLLKDDRYRKASITIRKHMAYKLLNKYKKKNLILSYFYNKRNSIFSFRYNDGTQGGIYLKDISHVKDVEPMN